MATPADRAEPGPHLLALFAQELLPTQGRWLAATRIACGCAITVAIAMIFRIPLPAYMAYLVFLTSGSDIASTVRTAVGGSVAVTLAVIFNLGLSQIDLGDPAIRLPALALTTFLAMLSVRTFALGPITFLAGFVAVTVQTVIDDVPSPEAFTRITLWLWVVVVVPVAVTVLINLLFGPSTVAVVERGFRKVLAEIRGALVEGRLAGRLAGWRALLVPLIEKADKYSAAGLRPGARPATLTQLVEVLVILDALPDPVPEPERGRLAGLVTACLVALEPGPTDTETAGSPPARPSDLSASPFDSPARQPDSLSTPPAVLAAADALVRLRSEILRPQASPAAPAAKHLSRSLFVSDAFTNPAHWQFALKTTLAMMIVYGVYTMLDWPGLRTSVVTCFFVALGSLGETVHKLFLRIGGAVIGGLIAGLSIVFVLPHFTDIGQLCALVAVVCLFAGWVATSSERLSYAGLQIGFAFFLGMLQTYTPATDLTVLRDRIVGILLGNIVMTLVFSTLWPESAVARLRAASADALRRIAALLRAPDSVPARQQAAEALARADHFEELSRFELQMIPERAVQRRHLPDLPDIERLAAAAFVLTSDSRGRGLNLPSRDDAASWVDRAAQATAEGKALPPIPASTGPASGTSPPSGAQTTLSASGQLAQLHLLTEIGHVAASAQ